MNKLNLDSPRTFKFGQYVNTSDGLTGYVFEDNGGDECNRYKIAICRGDEERCYSASELTLWVPKAGEPIMDAHGEVGEFLHTYGEDTSVVKWQCFPLPEIRLNTGLEPIWTD
jgi:hypothetical protein